MFSFIKNTLKKIYSQVTSQISSLFNLASIDENTLKELEAILIGADTGSKTSKAIIENLRTQLRAGTITKGADLKKALEQNLLELLGSKTTPQGSIYMLVGINGSGKTTFASKLAQQKKAEGKKVLLVAADTFRAAATEQLTAWAQRLDIALVTGNYNQDPASVVFQGCQKFKTEGYDCLIIDTAGRLQTKINLMKELAKIKNIVSKNLPESPCITLLTIDAMLGQNSFEQARLFHESTDVQGIVLTKMDGTGKGGIVFAITQELGIPVAYISCGEQATDSKPFDATEYVHQLLGNE